MKKLIGPFLRDKAGTVIAEFAMAFPLLILLVLGGFEIGRYVLLQQKLSGTSLAMADMVSQAKTLTAADVDALFQAVDPMLTPFSMGDKGVVIITSISASGGQVPKINWQRKGGGTLSAVSLLGQPGGNATLPPGFVVRDGENMIAAEVFYNYTPIMNYPMIPMTAHQLYNEALYRPRFGALT
ncbi:MAG: TadE/TadG family type IV pilus assembly protein, partial [Alphaproteobacteria bacterium]